jgi:hypothetical protein
MFRSIDHHQGAHVAYATTPPVEIAKCFTDHFNILT